MALNAHCQSLAVEVSSELVLLPGRWQPELLVDLFLAFGDFGKDHAAIAGMVEALHFADDFLANEFAGTIDDHHATIIEEADALLSIITLALNGDGDGIFRRDDRGQLLSQFRDN